MDNSEQLKCGHMTGKGTTCIRPAGWGTTHKGEGYCKRHDEATKHAMAKRSEAQVAFDRNRLTEMYVGGSSMYEIADEIKVSVATVSREIQALHRHWRENPQVQFDDMMLRTLANLDRLEWEAWEAWERSKAPRKITTTFGGRKEGGEAKVNSVQVQIIEQTGDKAYLDVIKECTIQRAKLGGLISESPDLRSMGMGIVSGMAATLQLMAQREKDNPQRGQPPSRTRIIGLND